MRVRVKEIVVDFMICKENYGGIVGFPNHFHLVRNLPLTKKTGQKKFNQKNYLLQSHIPISSKHFELWAVGIDDLYLL
jgi:hypothetical protein